MGIRMQRGRSRVKCPLSSTCLTNTVSSWNDVRSRDSHFKQTINTNIKSHDDYSATPCIYIQTKTDYKTCDTFNTVTTQPHKTHIQIIFVATAIFMEINAKQDIQKKRGQIFFCRSKNLMSSNNCSSSHSLANRFDA